MVREMPMHLPHPNISGYTSLIQFCHILDSPVGTEHNTWAAKLTGALSTSAIGCWQSCSGFCPASKRSTLFSPAGDGDIADPTAYASLAATISAPRRIGVRNAGRFRRRRNEFRWNGPADTIGVWQQSRRPISRLFRVAGARNFSHGGQGDRNTPSPRHPVTLSPCHPVTSYVTARSATRKTPHLSPLPEYRQRRKGLSARTIERARTCAVIRLTAPSTDTSAGARADR